MVIGWQRRVKPGDFIRVKRTRSPGTHLPTQTLDKVRTEMSLRVPAYIYGRVPRKALCRASAAIRPMDGIEFLGDRGVGCRRIHAHVASGKP